MNNDNQSDNKSSKNSDENNPLVILDKKLEHDKRMTVLSIISIIVVAVLIFAVFEVILYNNGLIEIPRFITKLLHLDNEITEIIPGDDGEIYEALKNNKSTDKVYLSRFITPEDIIEFFKNSSHANEYTLYNTVTYKSEEKTLFYKNKIWRQDNNYRIEQYDETGSLSKLIICDGSEISITSYGTENIKRTRIYNVNENFTLESEAGIPSLSSIKTLLESSDITEPDIALLRTSDNSFYSVSFGYSDLTQREEYFISLETSIIMRVEIYENGHSVYSVATDFFETAITGYSNINLFTISK